MITLSSLSKCRNLVLGVLTTCLISISILLSPFAVHAANSTHISTPVTDLSSAQIKNIEKQSTPLYEHLHYLKRSQTEIDKALLNQFGLRRIDINQSASPSISTGEDVSLPSTSIYASRGTIFTYSDFNWNCATGASCYGDPGSYQDDIGMWFTKSINVGSTYLSVSDFAGNIQDYYNPQNFSQAGADFSANEDFWSSGILEVAFKGDFPSGCTEIFTKYTHGWSSNEITSTSISVGFPSAFGVSVTYSQVGHSWQATGPTPAKNGC